MSFKSIADPLIRQGIAVVIAMPGERNSYFKDWQNLATTDPAKAEAWNTENPEYNCISVAKRAGVWMLDADNYAACLALGMQHLDCFTVKSPREGGYHFYFKHDELTAALPNRLNIYEGDNLIAEAKFHNHSCCSPGCTRKDGGKYVLVDSKEIAPAPKELIDWLVNNTKTPIAQETKKSSGLHPEMDATAILENFEFENDARRERGKIYFRQDSCRYCGRVQAPTDWDKICWILEEGVRFFYACVYCETRQKEVWAQLKEEYTPYEGPIWANWKEPQELLPEDEPVEPGVDILGPPDELPKEGPVEKCYRRNCNCGLEHAETSLSPETRKMMDESLTETAAGEEEEPGESLPATFSTESLSFEELLVATMRDHRASEPIVTVDGYLDAEPAKIPEEAMYGQLKEWAQQTELSMSIAYPAILAAYSAIPKHDEILGVRFNLYAALLMPVGAGKNLALDRAAKVLHMTAGTDYQDCTLGGAGGLWQALGEKKDGRGRDAKTIPGPRKMLLNPAEFGATLANTRIDGSTLSQHLCNLWDKNKITLPTREGMRPVDCRLSILGALPVESESLEQFSRFFAEEASHGLYSRFIFGYSQERLDNRWAERWKMKSEEGTDQESLVPTMPATQAPTEWDPEAEKFYSEISLPDDNDSRGLYNLKRIALLSATANGDKLVTPFCVQCAWFFMLWQAQLKRSLKVGTAQKVSGGELSAVIMQKLRAIDAAGNYERSPMIDGRLNINLARVIHKCDWASKYGSEAISRTVAALVKLGQLGRGQKYNTKKKLVSSEFHFTVTKFKK